jgi:serine/threonine-protein kinase RsbT
MALDLVRREHTAPFCFTDDLHFISIDCEDDIVTAREQVRAMATTLGFSRTDRVRLATAVSELANNIVLYARSGVVLMRPARNPQRDGITIVARDEGPGIESPALALRDGYSTSGRLGVGLPGVKRMMDEFRVHSHPGSGTTITVTKWLPR